MEKPNTNGDDQNAPKSNNSNNPIIGDNGGDGQGTNANTQSAHTIHHEPININIQPNETEDKIAIEANRLSDIANTISKKANRVSIANLIVAIAVFIFTFLLFKETQRANQTSKDALKLAKEQFDSAISAGVQSDIRADSLLAIQKRSVDAQIALVTTTINQFQSINKSYLRIGSFYNPRLNKNEIFSISYFRFNLGNQPIIITKGWATAVIEDRYIQNPITYMKQNKYDIPKDTTFNYIISKEQPSSQTYNSKFSINNVSYNFIEKQQSYICFIGKLVFRNTTTNKSNEYLFAFRFYINGQNVTTETMYEDTFPINE